MSTALPRPRGTLALLALLLVTPACKREEAESPAARAVRPYIEWCETQGAARSSCLVSSARVTGDATACTRLKPGASERVACFVAAARTSGRMEACRPLADRELVLCAFTVAAEHGRVSACDPLESVRWQGGSTRALCLAVARAEPDGCRGPEVSAELSKLCLRLVAVRLRDASLCNQLGKDPGELQQCAVAVAVARRAPQECAAIFAASPRSQAARSCEVEAEIARGRYAPCFGDPAQCERSLWVARPCEGTSGTWADDCRIHQAVFGTGPFGCGAVEDPKRRTLCGELRDAQEGYALRARGADAGVPPAAPR